MPSPEIAVHWLGNGPIAHVGRVVVRHAGSAGLTLRPRAAAATSGEAAAAGDIVVVTVPVKAFPDLPAVPLAGKTVIDTCNYGPERDGHIPELDSESLTSSELLLRYIPDAVLVKAFNNIFYKHLLSLARPVGAADRSYLPIAGDS